MTGATLDPVELQFIAQDVLETYIRPNFDLDGVPFEILSTVRYDPLLDIHPDTTDDFDNIGVDITNTEFKDNTTELLPVTDTRSLPSSQFFLFDEHLHRLKATLHFFEWGFDITKEILLVKLNEVLAPLDKNLPYKCRVTVSRTGDLRIEVSPTPIRTNLMEGFFGNTGQEEVWSVYIDKEPTAISPFTSFKTTRRDHYNESRARSLPKQSSLEEVLIFNGALQVVEGSITNIAFKRTKVYPGTGKNIERWVTPPLSSGCLCGVTRHMLISKNLIEEEPIKLSEVVKGEDVLLFNGIMGVVKGVIV